MSFFKKNQNEKAYVGGEKHFIDVIKNSGSGEFLIWRQPEEDFNTNSKLIVMPGEKALFVDGGNIVQTFEPGTYQLNTNNYPFISRLKNALSGGISTFNCVIYFFRGADSKEIKWGTDAPITVRDKKYNLYTDVRARGTYKVRIRKPELFLEKLIGNNIRFQEQKDLDSYFSNEMLTKTKTVLSRFLNSYKDEFVGIEEHLSFISEQLEPQINDLISGYGLQCVNFSVEAINVDMTNYKEISNANLEAIKKETQGRGEQAYMQQLGTNWDKVQSAEIMKGFAENQNGIGMIGAELGVGVATGSAFGQMANQMITPITNSTAVSSEGSSDDVVEILTKLKRMLDGGLIEQIEYDEKKKEILARM